MLEMIFIEKKKYYTNITKVLKNGFESVTKVLRKKLKWLFFTSKVLFLTFSQFGKKSVV